MQTLGLSGESRRSDGWLKSIFWPSVENAWDVDYLGQQGFWICVVIAMFQLVIGVASGNPIIMATNAAISIVFLIGATGVREASWPAAALIFALFFVGLLTRLAIGGLPGPISIGIAALLLSNVRAAFMASQWRPASEDEDKPTRFNESWRDKLVDQLPPKAWSILQVPFFALAALLLLLSFLAIAVILWHRLGGLVAPLHNQAALSHPSLASCLPV